jgi:hypothetical protein
MKGSPRHLGSARVTRAGFGILSKRPSVPAWQKTTTTDRESPRTRDTSASTPDGHATQKRHAQL